MLGGLRPGRHSGNLRGGAATRETRRRLPLFGRLRRRIVEPAERAQAYMHLVPGRHYRVVRAFVDHDGMAHPVGESWTFRRAAFFPYEDGLSLFVDAPGGPSRQIRLQHRPETEGPVVDAFDRLSVVRVFETGSGVQERRLWSIWVRG